MKKKFPISKPLLLIEDADMDDEAEPSAAPDLRSRIHSLESKLDALRTELSAAEQEGEQTAERKPHNLHQSRHSPSNGPTVQDDKSRRELESEEYKRYGRQLIMPEIGLKGQLALKNTSVLIIGIGGLGCPAAAYLAGAGVGTIGMVDRDTVELSNLHRQILHTTPKIGMLKVDSAIDYLKQLNPHIHYRSHPSHLEPTTAVDLVSQYNLILDCTDHPTSRYLISDACVLAQLPLISGSALRTEGQLMVLNNPPSSPYPQNHQNHNNRNTSHCYRCVFPKPPPAESVTTCGDGGILGPVVGTIGVLMAVEAIKLLLSPTDSSIPSEPEKPTLLIYSAFATPPFRTVRLLGKRNSCPACSPTAATITRDALTSGSLDYRVFCGVTAPVEILKQDERITAEEYSKSVRGSPHVLIDVREKVQFDICKLGGSVNLPFSEIGRDAEGCGKRVDEIVGRGLGEGEGEGGRVFLVCRYGNDSQIAVRKLKGMMEMGRVADFRDIKGGLRAWREGVDPNFPEY